MLLKSFKVVDDLIGLVHAGQDDLDILQVLQETEGIGSIAGLIV